MGGLARRPRNPFSPADAPPFAEIIRITPTTPGYSQLTATVDQAWTAVTIEWQTPGDPFPVQHQEAAPIGEDNYGTLAAAINAIPGLSAELLIPGVASLPATLLVPGTYPSTGPTDQPVAIEGATA